MRNPITFQNAESSETFVIDANPPRLFEPTMGLRWKSKNMELRYPTCGESVTIQFPQDLQQAWLCRETGEIEWRAVEVVT